MKDGLCDFDLWISSDEKFNRKKASRKRFAVKLK